MKPITLPYDEKDREKYMKGDLYEPWREETKRLLQEDFDRLFPRAWAEKDQMPRKGENMENCVRKKPYVCNHAVTKHEKGVGKCLEPGCKCRKLSQPKNWFPEWGTALYVLKNGLPQFGLCPPGLRVLMDNYGYRPRDENKERRKIALGLLGPKLAPEVLTTAFGAQPPDLLFYDSRNFFLFVEAVGPGLQPSEDQEAFFAHIESKLRNLRRKPSAVTLPGGLGIPLLRQVVIAYCAKS